MSEIKNVDIACAIPVVQQAVGAGTVVSNLCKCVADLCQMIFYGLRTCGKEKSDLSEQKKLENVQTSLKDLDALNKAKAAFAQHSKYIGVGLARMIPLEGSFFLLAKWMGNRNQATNENTINAKPNYSGNPEVRIDSDSDADGYREIGGTDNTREGTVTISESESDEASYKSADDTLANTERSDAQPQTGNTINKTSSGLPKPLTYSVGPGIATSAGLGFGNGSTTSPSTGFAFGAGSTTSTSTSNTPSFVTPLNFVSALSASQGTKTNPREITPKNEELKKSNSSSSEENPMEEEQKRGISEGPNSSSSEEEPGLPPLVPELLQDGANLTKTQNNITLTPIEEPKESNLDAKMQKKIDEFIAWDKKNLNFIDEIRWFYKNKTKRRKWKSEGIEYEVTITGFEDPKEANKSIKLRALN